MLCHCRSVAGEDSPREFKLRPIHIFSEILCSGGISGREPSTGPDVSDRGRARHRLEGCFAAACRPAGLVQADHRSRAGAGLAAVRPGRAPSLLTGEGEQLIAGCRLLLNSVSSLKEQAQLLRQGDTGVLKIAGSPQHIESVLSRFLHLYAKRYPKVEIRIPSSDEPIYLSFLTTI